MAELRQMMDKNTTVLAQVAQHTSRFCLTKAPRAPQSIFEMSFATQSIYYGDSGSVLSSTLFSFDDEIVNSQAYRRALTKVYASNREEKHMQNEIANQSGTVTNQTPNQAENLSSPGKSRYQFLFLYLCY